MAHNSAVSQRACSWSRSAADSRSASLRTAAAASAELAGTAGAGSVIDSPADSALIAAAILRRGAVEPPAAADQPTSAPFRLKSQVPSAYGAVADEPISVPTDAERTAHNIAPVRVTRARSARPSSAQIGPVRRYRAGTGSPLEYHPTPNPSTFIVPCRCHRGAHACWTRPCVGSNSTDLMLTSSPR